MTRLQRLKHEAQASATWRGHKLARWTNGRRGAYTYCVNCQQQVSVTDPVMLMPNECEIMGEAIALNCRQWFECLNCGELLSRERYTEGGGLCPPCLAGDKWSYTHCKGKGKRNG